MTDCATKGHWVESYVATLSHRWRCSKCQRDLQGRGDEFPDMTLSEIMQAFIETVPNKDVIEPV